jgi:hypothetical protein
MRLLLRLAVAGLALTAFTGACGKDSVAPKSPADPQATTAQLASLGAIFDVPALNSMSSVAGSIAPTSAVVPALQLAGAANPLMQSKLRPYAERIEGARLFTRLVPQMSVTRAAALFPPALLGKTFEWNFTTLQYDTTARTGAPSDGVRFILYAINELTGYPAEPAPGVEVGYVDLKDETGSGSPKVHITVAGVGGTPVYVDYTVTLASLSATSAKITTAGYITNGAGSPDSVRFSGALTVSVSSQSSGSVTQDFSLDVNSHDIHARSWQRVSFTESTLSLRVSFRFEHAGEVATLEGTLDVDTLDETVSGTITSRVDGGLFATCNVNGTASTFTLSCTGADEDGLNADEQAALDALGEAAGRLSDIFSGLLLPATGVLAGA